MADIDSDPEDKLIIDCDYEINKDAIDPMSLVSVYLASDEDEQDTEKVAESSEDVCSFCYQTFSSSKELNDHIIYEHCVVCQFCGWIFRDVESYMEHIKNVGGCKNTVETNPDHNRPVSILSFDSDVQQCPDCDQKFRYKTTLNIHRLNVHVAKNKNIH